MLVSLFNSESEIKGGLGDWRADYFAFKVIVRPTHLLDPNTKGDGDCLERGTFAVSRCNPP